MKILIAQNDYSLSGAPICAYELAAGLKALGHDVHTCATGGGDLQNEYKKLNISTIVDPRLFQDSAFGAQLGKQVDLVICFTSLAFKFVHGVKGVGKPCIFSIHEVSEIGVNWARENMLFRKALHRTDKVVFSCDYNRKQFLPYLNEESKASTIYMGYREPQINTIPPISNEVKCLIVGSYEPRKGQLNVIKALGKETGVDVTFIGRPLDQNYTNQMVQEASQTKNMTILTNLFREKVQEHIAATDIVIIPSKEEVPSLMVGEAGMLKKPIVASNAAGIPEGLKYDNGLLFNPNSTEDLKTKVMSLVHNKELRVKMGENGYKHFSEQKTMKQYVDAYLKLIGEVCA